MSWVYITPAQAIEIHRKTVEISGGGCLQPLELGKLDSVLQHIQNDDYYPTFELKLTHLFYGACKFHCFMDGNKRVAISLCAQMLLLNGYLRPAREFFRQAENISHYVAAGRISKELLCEWMTGVLHGTVDDNEALKLKILNAISVAPTGLLNTGEHP